MSVAVCKPLRDCLQRIELEVVKRERSHLMASLAEIKTQSGKAGGELQQEDVRRLRKEVELKMEKLNEIRKVHLLLTCCMPDMLCIIVTIVTIFQCGNHILAHHNAMLSCIDQH